ncbi:MAG: PEP-CTERM sorting domain-containing protein [Planctomycetota bacterium]
MINLTGFFRIVAIAAAAIATTATQTAAVAGTFHWGDLAGSNVMFLDVTENNNEATSLFAPAPGVGGPIVSGNSLHLDPQGFASQAENNTADLIDSTLSTTIMAAPGASIADLTITELGDYSLGGLMGSQATAQVGAAFFWTVLEVDNSPISLSTQATNLILGTGAGPNGGVYNRPVDDGTAVIWNGVAQIDLNSYLDSQNIDGNVTKVRLTFDNTLQTSAEAGSTAFIKKKSVDIVVNPNDNTNPTVPEPTSAALVGMAISLAVCKRRRG